MKLTIESSYEELRDHLLCHMESADESKSKVNPSLTKHQSWDIQMGGAMKESPKVKNILIKNAIKEFGSHYEN